MAKTTFATLSFGYNVDSIRYPWRESLTSALALADGVFFAACDEQTLASAKALAQHEPRLHVIQHPWAEYFPPEETHAYRIQAIIANRLLDEIGTKYDYALKLDADEVIFETSIEPFRRQLEGMNENFVILGKPHYTHFIDEHTEWDFIYRSRAVITRTEIGLRFNEIPDRGNADACAMGGAPEFQTCLEIGHYGKWAQGREEEALLKEVKFQELYEKAGFGFPDPLVVEAQEKYGYIDYHRVFHVSKEQGGFRKYNGPHPKFVRQWIEDSKLRSKEFWSTLKASQSNVADSVT